eukprot:scaffold1225_cov164-Amphora_coffeaeformis.AAC.22
MVIIIEIWARDEKCAFFFEALSSYYYQCYVSITLDNSMGRPNYQTISSLEKPDPSQEAHQKPDRERRHQMTPVRKVPEIHLVAYFQRQPFRQLYKGFDEDGYFVSSQPLLRDISNVHCIGWTAFCFSRKDFAEPFISQHALRIHERATILCFCGARRVIGAVHHLIIQRQIDHDASFFDQIIHFFLFPRNDAFTNQTFNLGRDKLKDIQVSDLFRVL